MNKIINGYKIVDGLFEAGSAAFPSIRGINSLSTTGFYFPSSTTIGAATSGVNRLTIGTDFTFNGVDGNFIISGGTATGKANIQFQSAASNTYDTNLFHVSSTAMTMGMIAGSTAAYAAANGPFIGLRGNTYSAVITQRGNLFFGAGNPSAPATGEGEIRFTTGADVQRMVLDKSGVVYIPTPSTNRFVVGGTAALGAGGSVATIIGNTSGVGVLALQNTTAANAGYAQVDLYNSSGTNVAGFGYGNTATVAITQDRTYFYTVAKDFHISTDSNTTRHFTVTATTGDARFAGNVAIATTKGFRIYNTADETTNTERLAVDWSSNIARIYTIPAGTGSARVLQISAFNSSAGGGSIQLASTAQFVNLTHSTTTLAGNLTGYTGTSTNSSGTTNNFVIIPTVSGQSGTAGYNALYISPGAAGGGSGTKNLIWAGISTTERFSLSEAGSTAHTQAAIAGGATAFTLTPGAHTAVTAMLVDFKVAAHTMTITGAFAGQIFSSFEAPTISAASSLTVDFATNVSIQMASVSGSAVIGTNTALVLGSPAGAVTVNNVAATHYSLFETTTQSFTLTATTQVTANCGFAAATLGQMTINQSGGAVTVDNVATLYLIGAPTAGASVTLTNKYTIFSDAGLNRFDGDGTHVFELPADATDPTGGGGAAAGRIGVKIGGATKYIAYY